MCIMTDIELVFPSVDPGLTPLGSRVLVQIRLPKRKVGSIILPDDVKDTDADNMQTARVVGMGPLAFKSRETGEPWVEGAWVQPGEFVRIPKYAGDRFTVPHPQPTEPGEKVIFAIFNDLDLTAKFTGDPLTHKAYI